MPSIILTYGRTVVLLFIVSMLTISSLHAELFVHENKTTTASSSRNFIKLNRCVTGRDYSNPASSPYKGALNHRIVNLLYPCSPPPEVYHCTDNSLKPYISALGKSL